MGTLRIEWGVDASLPGPEGPPVWVVQLFLLSIPVILVVAACLTP